MKAKKIIAAALAGVMTLSQFLAGVPAAAAAESDSGFNNEGVWLTEIYSNDVKRNAQMSGSYEKIKTFSSSEDLMEFVEIYSTHKEAISLNDTYDFYYGETPIAVTTMDGSSDITIEPNQTMVLWNCRSDLGTDGMPTAEDFISEMKVDENAVVLVAKTNGTGAGWAANNYAFSIKTKDGKAVSSFTCPSGTDVYTLDGFSVSLKVADLGAEMLVYRDDTVPTPGKVYSGQFNGLVQTQVPEDPTAKGLFITEVRPNDTDRTAPYTITGEKTGDDLMECFEIVNTTDQEIDLNTEYNFKYRLTAAKALPFDVYHFDETAENGIGSSEGCVIPAGGVAVIWNYRITKLPNIDQFASFPTEADFRAAYNIADDVAVYLWTNQNGLNNTNRGVEVYKLNEDGSEELVSYYDWVGGTDAKDNTSAILAVNPEGPQMLLSGANATSTIGVVDPSQYTYLQDDGSALELRLAKATDTFAQEDEVVPTSVLQGEEIRVDFYYAVTGALPRTGLSTYYRFDGEGEWNKSPESSARIPNLYECIISADELFDHDYVEFYVSASNRYRSTLSDLYKVEIVKLNEVDGVRSNITDGEFVKGTMSFTANNGGDNAATELYIDGVKQQTVPMMEDGAYFSFYADGRDSYFKNAITTTDNEWITAIGKWQTAISNGQAHHIDNSYFTYNAETDSYDVTLRIWAGTYGTTVDEYLYPEANREDFKVSQVELKLINGNSYLPTAIGPASFEGVDTSAKTNLSTAFDTVHSIGDSANMCPYMDVSFSVPAADVNGVGVQIDTTAMTEGTHTIKAVNGEDVSEVTFVVDNTAPVVNLGVADEEVLSGNITLNPTVDETNLDSAVFELDGEEIEVPFETSASKLGEGEHTLAVFAEDAAGNQTIEAVTFTVSNVAITLTNATTDDITTTSANAYLTMQSGSETNVTVYGAEKISKIESKSTDGIQPHIEYIIEVGEVADDQMILADWDGTASTADDTHATTMFVLNTVTGAWDKIGTADAEGSINASFEAKDHIADGKATVIVQCTADSALPDLDTTTDGVKDANADWDGTTVPADYDFSFAWITDTQYYAEQWQHHFLNMNNYIVDNAEALKTKYVIHTGDIVDDWNMVYEWENADEAMQIFDDAGMPYGVLGGNHDVAAGLEDNELYYDYFGEDRVKDQPTYGGSYVNNLGHYDLVSENGQDFIIVYMSWNIYQEEIDWMNQVLAQYADRKAILCFHPYTNVKASNDGILDYFGVLIQKEVVAKNPNVFAVLNGHYHGSSYQTVKFDDDNDGMQERIVYQICTDYQSAFEGGTEYIKYLYFDLDSDKVFINSYSPYLNDYNYYDNTGVDTVKALADASETGVVNKVAIDTIVLDVDFDSDVKTIEETGFSAYLAGDKLGNVTMDEDGTASVELSGLDAGTDYAWYAVAENVESGKLQTGVYEFTTNKEDILGKAEDALKAAEEAQAAAEAAQKAAETAKAEAEAAKAAAEAAAAEAAADKTAAEEAATLAADAQAKAEAAQAAAETAKTAAEAAQKAAEDNNEAAAAEAAQAAEDALKAAASASDAAASAASAADAYQKAQAAQTAAENAQAAAEAAADQTAEDKTAAEEAQAAAEAAQTKAEAAKDAAETAKAAAQEAAQAAEESNVDAAAEAAKAAQSAADSATNAADAAASAAGAADAYQKAQAAQAAAEAAQTKAEEAAANAAADKAAVEEALKAAQEAQAKAEAAQKAAEEAAQKALEEANKPANPDEDCPSAQYTDVAQGAWYHDAIDFMVFNGYMNGMDETTMAPDAQLTRAQLVQILYKVAGEPSVEGMTEPFADVADDAWYHDAIVWAYNTGVVNGTSETTFAPDNNITRQDIATILFRYAKAEAVEEDKLAGYTDADQIGEYAVDAMNWAVANGLVTGVTEDTLAPTANATRAQISTILMRYLQK